MNGMMPLLSLPVTKVIGPRALAPAFEPLLELELQPAVTARLSSEIAATATLVLFMLVLRLSEKHLVALSGRTRMTPELAC
jgi:hypothetical protein